MVVLSPAWCFVLPTGSYEPRGGGVHTATDIMSHAVPWALWGDEQSPVPSVGTVAPSPRAPWVHGPDSRWDLRDESLCPDPRGPSPWARVSRGPGGTRVPGRQHDGAGLDGGGRFGPVVEPVLQSHHDAATDGQPVRGPGDADQGRRGGRGVRVVRRQDRGVGRHDVPRVRGPADCLGGGQGHRGRGARGGPGAP